MTLISVITFVEDIVARMLLVALFGLIGFCLHETAHYRIAVVWTIPERANMYFAWIIPRGVDIESDDEFSNMGLRLLAIGPTLVFAPIFLISLLVIGVPPIPHPFNDVTLDILEVMLVSYYLMLFIALFPSPADIFGMLRPEGYRELVHREEPFSNEEALQRLLLD